MGFFEDLGKNNQESQAKKKIENTESKIQEQFKQLGTLVYKNYKESLVGHDDYDALIATIDNSYLEKKAFYDEWLKLQGLRECAYCKTKIAYESNFCNICGEKISKDAPSAKEEEEEISVEEVIVEQPEKVEEEVILEEEILEIDETVEEISEPTEIVDAFEVPDLETPEVEPKKEEWE